MGEMVTRSWDGKSVPLQEQGTYVAYLPDRLAGWHPAFPLATELKAERSSTALMRYQLECETSDATDWAVYHAEGMASSTMEGVHAPLWRVAQAECLPGMHAPNSEDDLLAAANVQITSEAVNLGVSQTVLTVSMLCEINAKLMDKSPKKEECGRLRTNQNWIGGFSPVRASYVPPPPEAVPWLMDDLMDFCAYSRLPPMIAAAIAHYQFEVIHPFADGNGRTGRALIHYVLALNGLVSKTTAPITAILVRDKARYISALNSARHVGHPSNSERIHKLVPWVELLSEASTHACDYGRRLCVSVQSVKKSWERALLNPTPTEQKLLNLLASTPAVNTTIVAEKIGVNERTARRAVNKLVDTGILKQRGQKLRNRVFYASAMLASIEATNSPQTSQQLDIPKTNSPPLQPSSSSVTCGY